ncbi:MAG: WYL domain-containing protein [Spirochaetales bacterium]|nr:WYL domain-containing protein [Spirochaetales bacterium]
MSEKEGNKFERMFRILGTLSQYSWTSATEIADMLGVSKRTVIRYIQDINIPFENTGLGLIESSRDGYRLTDTNFLDKLKGIDDIYTIAAIQTSPFGHQLHNNKIIQKDIMEKIIPRLNDNVYIEDETLSPLLNALLHNRVLEIEYLKNKGVKKYTVLPLKIISNSGTNYLLLYCLDDGYNKILSLQVNKITKIIQKEIFRDRELINEKLDYINSRWGTFINDRGDYEDEAVFEVDESLYLKLFKQPLHSTQIYRNNDGRHIFSIQVHNRLEFARWTMKYNSHITVIESQSIIDAIVYDAKQLLKKYT